MPRPENDCEQAESATRFVQQTQRLGEQKDKNVEKNNN